MKPSSGARKSIQRMRLRGREKEIDIVRERVSKSERERGDGVREGLR